MNKALNNYYIISVYIIWLIINFYFLISINDSTRLLASADVSSWIKPAKLFFSNHSFLVNTEYANQAVYRTPVIPLLISFSYIFTDSHSYIPFIILQILATFLTSFLLVKMIGDIAIVYKLFIIIVFLFNPNVISSVHLIQSEIFTMFFFTTTFYFINRYYKISSNKLYCIMAGLFLGTTILTRPSVVFLLLLLPIIFYILKCKSFKDLIHLKKNFKHLSNGLLSFIVALIIIFPWMTFVKSIEGKYAITSSESRYRFVWDQAIYISALSDNISYEKALNKTEYQENHQFKFKKCTNILDNSIERAKCFNQLTTEGYKLFFNNSLVGHLKALTRSVVQFFIAGGGQNFTNLIMSIDKKKLEQENKSWKNEVHKNIMLFNNDNKYAFVNTIISVTYAVALRIIGLLGIVCIFARKEYSYLIIITGVLAYFSMIHIYHGSSRYRVPIEPILAYLSLNGLLILNNFKVKLESK